MNENLSEENATLRDLLRRMREEACEAWRNVDLQSALECGAKRDSDLLREAEELIGPTAWDALDPAVHIEWGDRAICHWTLHPPARWPTTQSSVKIAEVITQLPCADDETLVEFVTRPDADWNGVTCDACRVRLPTLLRELTGILDDLQEGILEGHRTHPETLRAKESYAKYVEPNLTTEQRVRYAEQAQRINAKNARRAARRSREQRAKAAP
ncbi:MAG TPA: hypothetical protein VLE97_06545 [Gaiellaceae bacterium]|nr:hypothetical protein [Gaiellaceae bacterium]